MPDLHLDPIKAAIRIARIAHAGQLDKAGKPYIEHPLRVMERMNPDDVEGRVVAVLHDVVEDTEITLDDLRDCGFSETIVRAVDALTHPKTEPRKDYLRRVAANALALRVKLADVADNSSEHRIGLLTDEAMVTRLREKYRVAREYLGRASQGPRHFIPQIRQMLSMDGGGYFVSVAHIADELDIPLVLAMAAADCLAIDGEAELYTFLNCACDPEGFDVCRTRVKDGWPPLPNEPCEMCGQAFTQERARYSMHATLVEREARS